MMNTVMRRIDKIIDWWLDYDLRRNDTSTFQRQQKTARVIYAVIGLNILATMTAANFIVRRLRRL